MIEIRKVEKKYQMGESVVHALRGVSLDIGSGDFVAVMGPSGSGKSSLMHVLGLLDSPDSGSLKIDGIEVSELGERQLAELRSRHIGFVFQQFNLLPRMSALDNVRLPCLYGGKAEEPGLAQALLERVGLGPRSAHKPTELSGGQQQRVAIARALINRPRLILADEPTGNLDSASEDEVMAILKDLNQKGITVVIVTHEESIGRQAKRIIRMRDGKVQSDERLVPVSPPNPISMGEPSSTPSPLLSSHLSRALQHVRQGFESLASNKIRTGLSMLGVLIGVAAVIAMMALGTGARIAMEQQFQSMGSNLLILRTGATRVGGVTQALGAVTRLDLADAAAIPREIPYIRRVGPVVNGQGQAAYLDRNWSAKIVGVLPAFAEMHSMTLQAGRFFTDTENLSRARVAVLSSPVAEQLFGRRSPINEMIKINKVSFQVVGVTAVRGGGSSRDADEIIFVPVVTALKRLLGREHVDYIEIEVEGPEVINRVITSTLGLLASRHKIPVSSIQGAYTIRDLTDIREALSESSRTMSLLLASIAAISLLVGGIGIMNTMLVSVIERTREVGVRKAIGASNGDILLQFLAESVVITGVGGLLGIALGGAVAAAFAYVAGWSVAVSAVSLMGSLLFSGLVGVVFGVYPARKAALLSPVEALRHD